MMFPAIATGKCDLCGIDGLLYDAGGKTLHCEICCGGFLAVTESYLCADGFIFFRLLDGRLSDGESSYDSVAAMEQQHEVISSYRATIH